MQEYQANVLEQTRKLAEKSGKIDTARQDKYARFGSDIDIIERINMIDFHIFFVNRLKTNELLASAQMKARSLSASSLHV